MGKSNRKTEGQYVPLPYAQLKSVAWRSLSGSAVRLWLELHTRYNGGNNGSLRLSYAEAGELLNMGKATVQRAYSELVEKGFLAKVSNGNFYGRRAHEWRLTTKPMQKVKGTEIATHNWRHYQPKKQKRGSRLEPSHLALVPPENHNNEDGSEVGPIKAKSGVDRVLDRNTNTNHST